MPDGEHEQALLALHVPVEGRFGKAGRPGDIAHPRRAVPVVGEHAHGGGDHLGEPLMGAALTGHGSDYICK